MTLTFPLTAPEFFNKMRVRSVRWSLAMFTEDSGTGSGQTIRAELAPPKWMAEITSVPMNLAEARTIRALMRTLLASGRDGTFHLYNPECQFPLSDPTGSQLSGYVPFVHTVLASNRRVIRLGGLPANFELSVGDMFSISSKAPNDRLLLEVSEACVANGSGSTPFFSITPWVRPGVAINDPVDLISPMARMMMIGVDAGISEAMIGDGMTFNAIEVVP